MDYLKEIDKLKNELARARFELAVFYEITQIMRSTLRLDEILYIILTGITSNQGLGFNRALLFLVDYNNNLIKGRMGIGPYSYEEASKIWKWIEEEKKDMVDLAREYHRIKESKPKLFRVVEEIVFSLEESTTVLHEVFNKKKNIHACREDKAAYKEDPLVKKFNLEGFVVVPLWMQNKIIGMIVVDNFITKREIEEADIRILNMFSSQAALAIENSKMFEDVLWRSHIDSLTGLWNHGYFQFKLKEEFERCRSEEEALSLLMIDIDNFKSYNDKFGHIEGDKTLVRVADAIKNELRKSDYPCRYGGEEFGLILPGIKKEEAIFIAERMRQKIENEEFLRQVTVSVGVVSSPKDVSSCQDLVKMADEFLYRAKSSGKNKVFSKRQ